jgi:GntR family transcriptional regulator, transcriptional repressor for pyruvate dehydrogenase complex
MAMSAGRDDSIPGRRTGIRGAGDKALNVLTEWIRSKELGPGDQLPTERQLAQMLGMSRNTVREGVRALEVMGVVEVRQGSGTYVTSLEPHDLLQATTFITQLFRDTTVLEMLEVRSILESWAAKMAAVRITDDELDALEKITESLELITDIDEWIDADVRFHSLIAEAAGNELLVSLLDGLSTRTYWARHLQADLKPDVLHGQGLSSHRRIFEAVASRDPHIAALEAGLHVSHTAAWLRSMQQDDAPARTAERARRRTWSS